MLRKCGLFVLSFAVLSTSLSVLFSGVSSAASVYDDWYNETDELVIERNNVASKSCNSIDLSNSWYSSIIETNNYYEIDTIPVSDYVESLQDAINGDGRWIVTQNKSNSSGGYNKTITVIWTEDTSLEFHWINSYMGNGVYAGGNDVKTITIQYKDAHLGASSVDCNDIQISGSLSSVAVSTQRRNPPQASQVDAYFSWIDENNFNLPPDYSGQTPRQDPPGSINYRIQYEYDINDKLAIFKSTTQTDQFEDLDKLTLCYFQIEKELTGVYYEVPFDCEAKQSVRYDFEEYGKYYVNLIYIYDGDAYSSINTAPLDIDGSAFSGSICPAGMVTCNEDNTNVNNSLTEYFGDRSGHGLTAVLIAPIMFYKDLPNFANSCTPINTTLMTLNISLPCFGNTFQAWSPFIFTMYQSIVNAVVAYFVALGVVRTIKNTSDPKDDRIEVTTL